MDDESGDFAPLTDFPLQDAVVSLADFQDGNGDATQLSADTFMQIAKGTRGVSGGGNVVDLRELSAGAEGVCETPGAPRDMGLSGGWVKVGNDDDDASMWQLQGGAAAGAMVAGGRVWGVAERTLATANDSDPIVNAVNVDIGAKQRYLKVIAGAVGRPFRYQAAASAAAPFSWMGWMPLPRKSVEELMASMAEPMFWNGVGPPVPPPGLPPVGPGVSAAITNMNPNLANPADRRLLFQELATALGKRWHAAATNKVRDAAGANMSVRPVFSKWSKWDHNTNLDLLGDAVFSWQVKLRRLMPTRHATDGDGDENNLGMTAKRLRQIHNGLMVLLDVLAVQSLPELNGVNVAGLAHNVPPSALMAMLSKPVLRDILDVAHDTSKITPTTAVDNPTWVYTGIAAPNANTVTYTFTKRAAVPGGAPALATPLNPRLTARFAALVGGFPASLGALGAGLPPLPAGGVPAAAAGAGGLVPALPPGPPGPPGPLGPLGPPGLPVPAMGVALPAAGAWIAARYPAGPAVAPDIVAAFAALGGHAPALVANNDAVLGAPGDPIASAQPALDAPTSAWREAFIGTDSHPTETGNDVRGQPRWTWAAGGAMTDNGARPDGAPEQTMALGRQVWANRAAIAAKFSGAAAWPAAVVAVQAAALAAADATIQDVDAAAAAFAAGGGGGAEMLEALAGVALVAGLVPMSLNAYIRFALQHDIQGLRAAATGTLVTLQHYWVRWMMMLEYGDDVVGMQMAAGPPAVVWPAIPAPGRDGVVQVNKLSGTFESFNLMVLVRRTIDFAATLGIAGAVVLPAAGAWAPLAAADQGAEVRLADHTVAMVDVRSTHANPALSPMGCAVAMCVSGRLNDMPQKKIASNTVVRSWELPSTWAPGDLAVAQGVAVPCGTIAPAAGGHALLRRQYQAPERAFSMDQPTIAGQVQRAPVHVYPVQVGGVGGRPSIRRADRVACNAIQPPNQGPRAVVLGTGPRVIAAQVAARIATPNLAVSAPPIETVFVDALAGRGRSALSAMIVAAGGVPLGARLAFRGAGSLALLASWATNMSSDVKMVSLVTVRGQGDSVELSTMYHERFKFQRGFGVFPLTAEYVADWATLTPAEKNELAAAWSVFPPPVNPPADGAHGDSELLGSAVVKDTNQAAQLPFAVATIVSVDACGVLRSNAPAGGLDLKGWRNVTALASSIPRAGARSRRFVRSNEVNTITQMRGLPGPLAFRGTLSHDTHMMRPFPTTVALASFLDRWAAHALYAPGKLALLRAAAL